MMYLDISIVAAYILATLGFSMYNAGYTRTFREYAVGTKNHFDSIIVMTILATFIGGRSTFGAINTIYVGGYYYWLHVWIIA